MDRNLWKLATSISRLLTSTDTSLITLIEFILRSNSATSFSNALCSSSNWRDFSSRPDRSLAIPFFSSSIA